MIVVKIKQEGKGCSEAPHDERAVNSGRYYLTGIVLSTLIVTALRFSVIWRNPFLLEIIREFYYVPLLHDKSLRRRPWTRDRTEDHRRALRQENAGR